MNSQKEKLIVFIIQTLCVNDLVKMVEPVSISVVFGIGAVRTGVGFLARYIYDKATEEPHKNVEENKMGNVIVTNIKEAVEVEDHHHVIIGIYIIAALLVLMIIGYFLQQYIKSIERRTLRRALRSSNELENVAVNQ